MDDRSDRRAIAFARFPSLICHATRSYRSMTGLTVVTTLTSASPDRQARRLPSPPVHPLCARLLRRLPQRGPCDEEWHKHIRFAAKTRCSRVHTCSLGLHCAGVTIVVGDELLGVAKCVCGPKMTRERFRSHVRLLEDMIARPCLELQTFLLREDVRALHAEVSRLRRVKRPTPPRPSGFDPSATEGSDGNGPPEAQTLTGRMLDYLREHFTDSMLSLTGVARALGKNEKYISHLFARQVGERMRTYITRLRLARACELLLQTQSPVAAIASQSGFGRAVQFRHSFRRVVGVTASEYRRIFTRGARS